jgi:hypothetical protein
LWIRIQEAKKNYPKNRKKSRIFMFLSTGCSLLRAEGFSCSLGVLYGGLGISKLQSLIKKIEIKYPAINFLSILGHVIRKNAVSGSVSGSVLNQCGSETPVWTLSGRLLYSFSLSILVVGSLSHLSIFRISAVF